jgi:hypothetical protein
MRIKYILMMVLSVATFNLIGQIDTTPIKDQSIKVKSFFKPVLRNAVKQTFYATPPITDTTKPTLSYVVPSQNLFFSYQPVSLKPLALQNFNIFGWENSNYIKVGFGNYSTPYVSAGFSLGNGSTTALGIYADYISSKGTLKNQDFTKLGVAFQGAKSYEKGYELKGKVGYNQDEYFLYGYNNSLFSFTKDQLRQRFQTITLNAGFRNTIPTEFGLNYNPTLQSSIFSDNRSATETNILLNLPLEKNIGETFAIKLGAAIDYTNYKKTGTSINNNIIYVNPALLYKSKKVKINAGISPTWDNSVLNILPNVTTDIQVQGSKFVLQLGWLGYYNKGSYQRWTNINPYINQPNKLPNTKVDERFIGIKGTTGNHLVYAVKAGYYGYTNMPLFVNDTISGKSFNVVNESKLQAVHLHAEVGVIEKEIFHFTAGFNLNNYITLQDNAKAWGLLPFDITASLRWQLFKGLWLKSDAFIWDGARFKNGITSNKLSFVLDINAGLEFKIAKQFNVWLQANNMANNKYQRWRNYETYGFNLLGGVKYSFATKPAIKSSTIQ